MTAQPLPRAFFLHPPDIVARALLGKLILRHYQGTLLTGRIVETEAYFGQNDPAAHAFAGRTARTQVLFGPPGHAYVYFVYGMHYCLNIACEPEGQAGCVLIRALEPVDGVTTMATLRHLAPSAAPRLIASGPGKLCQALAITRAEHNSLDLTDPASALVAAEDDYQPGAIITTTRIGIRKDMARPARFYLAGNPNISAPAR